MSDLFKIPYTYKYLVILPTLKEVLPLQLISYKPSYSQDEMTPNRLHSSNVTSKSDLCIRSTKPSMSQSPLIHNQVIPEGLKTDSCGRNDSLFLQGTPEVQQCCRNHPESLSTLTSVDCTKMRFAVFLMASLLLVGYAVGQENGDCVANAMARTDPNNAVGEAVSNAVAQSFSKVIVCEDGSVVQPGDSSSLAIAVSVAISESRGAAQECTASADAQANEVGEKVAGKVAEGLVAGSPSESEKKLTQAWLNKERGNVAERVKQGELSNNAPARTSSGCLDIRSILGAAPTAADVGATLDKAINEILTAVTCGNNVENNPDTPCAYDGANFSGDCTNGPAPAENAGTKPTGASVMDGRKLL